MNSSWKYLLGFLSLIAVTVWLAVLYYPKTELHLIACDVGQGDAILAVYGKTQILVDGGPGDAVLNCLSSHMPFWDREIELIILSHPQTDHFTGLIEVFKRYKVDKFLATPIDSGTESYQVLKDEVGGSGTDVVYPSTGIVIRLGLIHLDILHPSEEYILSNSEGSPVDKGNAVLGASTTTRDPNDFSIVAILSLGEFDALLTGDIEPDISNLVAKELISSAPREIEYIKIPHHGSKNGLSSNLLAVTSPEVAVISVGKDNRYGHPNKEVLDMLARYASGSDELTARRELEVLRTDEMGDVEVVTDGDKWWIAN